MIDAAVARFGWGVLALAIAATIGVRLATPDCGLPLGDEQRALEQRAIASFEAEQARLQVAILERQLEVMDRRVGRAVDAVVRAQRGIPERPEAALARLVHELEDIELELDVVRGFANAGDWIAGLRSEHAIHLTEIERVARRIPEYRQAAVGLHLVMVEHDIDTAHRVERPDRFSDRSELWLTQLRWTRKQLFLAFDDPNVEVSWPTEAAR